MLVGLFYVAAGKISRGCATLLPAILAECMQAFIRLRFSFAEPRWINTAPTQQINMTRLTTSHIYLAEREGFEPSLELAPH